MTIDRIPNIGGLSGYLAMSDYLGTNPTKNRKIMEIARLPASVY